MLEPARAFYMLINFSIFNFFYTPCSLTDKTQVSGTCNEGSIPSKGNYENH